MEKQDCPVGLCPVGQESRTAIEVLKSEITNIRDAVLKIERHMEESSKTNISLWVTLLGVIAGLVAQTAFFVFFLGGSLRQVEINTKRLDVLEKYHYLEIKNSKQE